MAIAEVLGTSAAELHGLLRATLLMLFQLFWAAESPNVANLQFLTGLDTQDGNGGRTGT